MILDGKQASLHRVMRRSPDQNARTVCALQRHQALECLFHRLTRGTSTAPVENVQTAAVGFNGTGIISRNAQDFFADGGAARA